MFDPGPGAGISAAVDGASVLRRCHVHLLFLFMGICFMVGGREGEGRGGLEACLKREGNMLVKHVLPPPPRLFYFNSSHKCSVNGPRRGQRCKL